MDAIKSWAITVCMAALAAGMANIIAPKGNLEKVYKFAVSLFFLCCVLMPAMKLTSVHFNINLQQADTQQSAEVNKTINSQAAEQAQENVSSLVRNYCVQNGAVPQAVVTTISQNKDGAMSVDNVRVVLKPSDMGKKTEIETVVKNSLGISITIKEGGN